MDGSKSKIIIPKFPENLRRLFEEEERIRKDSLVLLKNNADFDKTLGTYEKAMDVIYSIVNERTTEDDSELAIVYIGIRLFNALAVSLRLMLCGYYQISFAIQRDIIETYFLLDYFRSYPAKIAEWKNANNDARMKNYSPRVIRDILDKRDGYVNKEREKKYKMFCEYAAHVNYQGNKLVVQKGLGTIGPFLDEKYLESCFTELSDNGFFAALLFMDYFTNIKENIVKIKLEFMKQLADWYRRRFKEEPKIELGTIDKLIASLS